MKACLVNKLYLFILISSFSAWANPACVEEKTTLWSEFIPLDFDKGRSTVGVDQVEPVKNKVQGFIKDHPEMVVTDISVTASASKTPFYIEVKGRKVLDPESDEKNFSLSKERAEFVEKSFATLRKGNSAFKKITIETKATLAGPDFIPLDLNDRFVSHLTPGYKEKVAALYEKNKDLYADVLVTDSDSLLDEKKFVNLYQAKFRPFHGFKLVISGYKKECLEKTPVKDESPSSSKQ